MDIVLNRITMYRFSSILDTREANERSGSIRSKQTIQKLILKPVALGFIGRNFDPDCCWQTNKEEFLLHFLLLRRKEKDS